MEAFGGHPEAYDVLSDSACVERILAVKRAWGPQLILLAHHYQRGHIIKVADYIGDSFGLAESAARVLEASHIVFCGVRFMAESAAILCRQDQRVIHPEPEAGCPMADMAPMEEVMAAWEDLTVMAGRSGSPSLIPITYMNSHAALKGFVGRHGGTVCTSSNADVALTWALNQRSKVFFFPDQHLGRNTAAKMGMTDGDLAVYRPSLPAGGISTADLQRAKVILWDGHCPVHMKFEASDIKRYRRQIPGCKIVVHPEVTEDIALLADVVGSTSDIVKYVAACRPGDVVFVGTEINLVSRLAEEYPDRKVFRLHRSLCPTMYMIQLSNLTFALEHVDQMPSVCVDEETRNDARLALKRMLELTHAQTA
jgi:quinolinate synthase